MKSNYERLSNIISEGEALLHMRITSSSPEFQAWKMKSARFLISVFGENSHEYTDFRKSSFSLGIYTLGTPEYEFIAPCHDGIRRTIAKFKVYLEDMSETEDLSKTMNGWNYRSIFIVHGHNGELKESVARIIEKQNIDAIILSEMVNQGRTIIEKFEDYSDVGGAICLFTSDDIGKGMNQTEQNPRARQNVVFETGYFIGKLGRSHIVILADQGVELPSDLSGVVYTDSKNWQFDLLRELSAMGYVIDLNKLLPQ